MTRYQVLKPGGHYDDVGYDHMEVLPSGALGFGPVPSPGFRFELIYAPHAWREVTRLDED